MTRTNSFRKSSNAAVLSVIESNVRGRACSATTDPAEALAEAAHRTAERLTPDQREDFYDCLRAMLAEALDPDAFND